MSFLKNLITSAEPNTNCELITRLSPFLLIPFLVSKNLYVKLFSFTSFLALTIVNISIKDSEFGQLTLHQDYEYFSSNDHISGHEKINAEHQY